MTSIQQLFIFVLALTSSMLPNLIAQGSTTWQGFTMEEFSVSGHQARLVLPHEWPPEKHWVWRMRFWGHEPQTDLTLLDRGFAIAWIDVSDLYGSPTAVQIGNNFYDHLINTYGLHDKPVLEGFSRGGLMAYHWALANPTKVSCIYADAPVLDILSWPGGQRSGSEVDWQKCLDAYGLSEDSLNFVGIIDRAEELVAADIPILHVCGEADSIVPYAENTGRLHQAMESYGGNLKIILKAGVGHHPHSLENPRPIIKFILDHTDANLLNDEDLSRVQPSIEFRRRWNQSVDKGTGDTIRVAFLGGSITYGGGWRDSLMQYFEETYPDQALHFINAGIPSMGSTPGAFRLAKDVLSHGSIDLLFVEAAVNDATNGRSAISQIRGMEGIVRHTLKVHPGTDIFMMHFADPDKLADYNRGEIPGVIAGHEQVATHYDIPSLNLAKEVAERILNGEFTWKDDFKDLHPSPFGHGIYAHSMISALEELRGRGRQASLKLPAAIDSFSYDLGKLVPPDRARLGQGWMANPSWNPRDGLSTRPGFVEVPAIEATEPGARLTLNFEGRGVGILVPAGGDVGNIYYQVDQLPERELDQFTRWSHFLHLPWLYVLEDELARGPHTLTLTISAGKNPRSKGHACRILAFAIND